MNMLPTDLMGWDRRNARATKYAIGAALLALTIVYSVAWVALGSTL